MLCARFTAFFQVPRQSYANMVGLGDEELLRTQAGYCGKLDAATVKAIVGDAEDRDFVIFKANPKRWVTDRVQLTLWRWLRRGVESWGRW